MIAMLRGSKIRKINCKGAGNGKGSAKGGER